MRFALPLMTELRSALFNPASGTRSVPYGACKRTFDQWYNSGMTAKLSKELSDALNASGTSLIEAVDPASGRVYFIVDGDTHRQAMEALRQRQERDAIAQGIADMEAGRGKPVAEADAYLREKLGFPQRTTP